ncbi:MAG: ABC transporter permease [Acidobacteria bacterium]|nr:ABC transporter permease [Acidobacteriota bacterium]
MFGFHLKMAWLGISRAPWISVISIGAIALGVAVSTSMTSLHHLFTQDPIPEKSDRLFNVRTDSWDPDRDFFAVPPGEPPKAQTYRDMKGLMENDIALGQTGVANATGFVFPKYPQIRPYQSLIRLCHADFFSMFNVPFKYGGPWSRDVDQSLEAVVVLSQDGNQKLFGGDNSVGESVRIGTREFTVIGVLDEFQPMPLYYDVVNSLGGKIRDFFVPFDFIRQPDLELSIWGDTDGWGPGETFQGDNLFTQAEFYWIQYWVELAPANVADYEQFVDDYAREQKALGRFPRPLNNRVTPLLGWVSERNFGLGMTRAMMIISILFLAVCAINLSGLLLGKFLARSSITGVHRALGASRRAIFLQHLLECELIGFSGGALGLLLAFGGLRWVARAISIGADRLNTDLFTVDGFTAVIAFVFALVAGMVAGLYPSWRAGRVAPALQLKV